VNLFRNLARQMFFTKKRMRNTIIRSETEPVAKELQSE